MDFLSVILLCVFTWLGFALFVAWLRVPRPRGGDATNGAILGSFLIRLSQVYSRVLHRVRVEGMEHVPDRSWEERTERGLLLVANHTAGVDPVLLFGVLDFEPRFVMAEDMRTPLFEGLFRFGRVIFVDRTGEAGRGAAREIVRELKAGGVIGLFPEGLIERPPRTILPFKEGVGLFVRRTGALVLPVVIEGTPDASTAWGSLYKPSRSRVRFLPVRDYKEMGEGRGMNAREIAEDLRACFLEATGWPANDERGARQAFAIRHQASVERKSDVCSRP